MMAGSQGYRGLPMIKWVEWLQRLHSITGELSRRGVAYDNLTLTAWADELRNISEDMRRESQRGPDDTNRH
jgi:hypothetical protein